VSVVVAGVGNVFLGDDGFGAEVARRLARQPLPAGLEVTDYGIRGLHLAYRLLDPVSLLVVADVARRGGAPGTLYVIEPDVEALAPGTADGHAFDLAAVFSAVRSMGGELPRIRIVACEPASLGERIGLSAPVEAAVEPALRLVRELVEREAATAAPAVAVGGST
jgi:hydrogenase maturation protease